MHRISKVLATGIAGLAMLGGALIFLVPTAASAAPANAATVSTAAATCTWQYVVTDGVPNDVRIFPDPNSNSVVGVIHPNQYFSAPYPTTIVAGRQGTRLHVTPYDGWVNFGDWIQFVSCP